MAQDEHPQVPGRSDPRARQDQLPRRERPAGRVTLPPGFRPLSKLEPIAGRGESRPRRTGRPDDSVARRPRPRMATPPASAAITPAPSTAPNTAPVPDSADAPSAAAVPRRSRRPVLIAVTVCVLLLCATAAALLLGTG